MRPSRGLSAKNLGPYKVRALPNRYAVELALPDCYKQVHPVFHPWLLHLDADQTARPSEGVIAEKHPDGEHDYYVDMVVDCRIDKRRKDTLTNKKGMLQYKLGPGKVAQLRTSVSKQKQGPEG
ncbi:hypothetical protein A1F94_009432 [Pyrenophora tritici-repentis]|nr:hypothetical protein A1F94_009432 [Pyrenophora tritici-repentis]